MLHCACSKFKHPRNGIDEEQNSLKFPRDKCRRQTGEMAVNISSSKKKLVLFAKKI